MFLLFYSLYVAMFTGTWQMFGTTALSIQCSSALSAVGTFLTSIFGDNTYSTLGDLVATNTYNFPTFYALIALVLATITSIGIVVMAVKGIKRIFSVFFYGVR